MKCPFCSFEDTRVLDSRPTDEGEAIRRRRECVNCVRRFTTYERIEEVPLVVIKKDGRREPFERAKLLTGLVKACEKRPVPLKVLEQLVDEVETDVRNDQKGEVYSSEIGERVMDRLRKVDDIAYVRFASVYRQFADVGKFLEELSHLLDDRKKQ